MNRERKKKTWPPLGLWLFTIPAPLTTQSRNEKNISCLHSSFRLPPILSLFKHTPSCNGVGI